MEHPESIKTVAVVLLSNEGRAKGFFFLPSDLLEGGDDNVYNVSRIAYVVIFVYCSR